MEPPIPQKFCNWHLAGILSPTCLNPGGGPINLRTVEPDTASGSVRVFAEERKRERERMVEQG